MIRNDSHAFTNHMKNLQQKESIILIRIHSLHHTARPKKYSGSRGLNYNRTNKTDLYENLNRKQEITQIHHLPTNPYKNNPQRHTEKIKAC